MADGLGKFGFAGDFGQLVAEPCRQLVEQRLGFLLADAGAVFGRLPPRLFLDAVERGDALDGFVGNDGTLGL